MEQAIVLGRIGHYFDAGNGSCSTALVVDVGTLDTGEVDVPSVTVKAWHHGGDEFVRSAVQVVAQPSTDDGQNSFHLNRDCPWSR